MPASRQWPVTSVELLKHAVGVDQNYRLELGANKQIYVSLRSMPPVKSAVQD